VAELARTRPRRSRHCASRAPTRDSHAVASATERTQALAKVASHLLMPVVASGELAGPRYREAVSREHERHRGQDAQR
jgi:hypothetical protein